ncbi:MAG: polysaccharide biosynthesis/export family protein [Gammaproteobacteria bacterium]
MKKNLSTLGLLALVSLFFPLFTCPANADAEKKSLSDYRLGVGDKISIQVYGEPDLSIEATLTDAGTISYPLIGELKVSKLTIGKLSALIVDELKGRYIVDPKVTINIVEYRNFFINGEVKKPGAYPYEPGLTIYKAVTLAGGFTNRASRSSITLLAEDDPEQNPRDVGLTAPINPGDIINVEESFF